MQVSKISLVLALFIVLCSFSYDNASYKATQYTHFLSKFEQVKSPKNLLLDVRINMPLPRNEAELEEANLNRWDLKKVVEQRMLMSEFDIFISEISKKGKGGTRPKTYEAEFLVKQTKKLDVVVYSEYQDSRQYHKTYYMAVFSKLGTILAKEYIGMSNEHVYAEVSISDRLIMDAISILDGQKLPLSVKKIKIERKGSLDILEDKHPYLDKAAKTFTIGDIRNYRLR